MAEIDKKQAPHQGQKKEEALSKLALSPLKLSLPGLAVNGHEPGPDEKPLQVALNLMTARRAALNVDNAVACMLNGWIYHGIGNLQQAADYFKKALVADPDSAEALVGQSSVFFHLGNYEKALASLRQALTKPMSQETKAIGNLLLASVCRRLERHEEAVSAAEDAISACSDASVQTKRLLRPAYLEAAAAHLGKGEVSRAVDYLQLVLGEDGKEFKRFGKPVLDLKCALDKLAA